LAKYNDKNKFCLGVTTVTWSLKYFFCHADSCFVFISVNKEINIMLVELFDSERNLICEPAEFKFGLKPKSILLGRDMPPKIVIAMGEHYKNEKFRSLFKDQDLLQEMLEWITELSKETL